MASEIDSSTNQWTALSVAVSSLKIGASFEGKLKGAEKGKVVTRFPPEPSGYLHIGHAKAVLLNAYYATIYEGKMILRFDDTNPARENQEFEDSIIEDLKLLNVTPHLVSYTSNYFPLLIEYCEKMIQKGLAYCDDTEIEVMRKERGEGIDGKNRNNSCEHNLRIWNEMVEGTEKGASFCVRAKIDMQAKNKCMRDPVMYRTVGIPHHRTGTKYKVYPTYDFACPVVDSIEGVTHAMRTNEYSDRIPQYNWFIEALGMRAVSIYEFSRLNFVNTVLSKRKLTWFVENKLVSGWDDPRFPTVRGIIRRGLSCEALLSFILDQGPSKAGNLMEWDKLWTVNKQYLDPIVPRYTSVGSNYVKILLKGAPSEIEIKERALHPKNNSLGTGKLVTYNRIVIELEDANLCTDGEEITLIGWGNAIIDKIIRNKEGSATEMEATLNLEGDFKKTKKKLHWLVDNENFTTPCILRELDHLISKKKPEEGDEMVDLFNRDSLFDTNCIAEKDIFKLKVGDAIQFQRRGYFIVDSVAENSIPMVLIKIPDGKSKAVSVISTKVDAAKISKGH